MEFFAAQGSYAAWDATNFRLVGDTANGGLAVTAPVVSGGGSTLSYRPIINTDVQGPMAGGNASAFLRLPFSVSNPAVDALTLRMKYDDGFVAYLNGREIARRNGCSPQWNSTATTENITLRRSSLRKSMFQNFAMPCWPVTTCWQSMRPNRTDRQSRLSDRAGIGRIQGKQYFQHVLSTPTPAGLNSGGFITFVADTKFSVDRGVYTAPFSLVITTATASATIIT